MNQRTRSLLTILLAFVLACGSLTLVGCGGSNNDAQDNCYGEDMPVTNE
ncbi:MAG: hypothetical protein IKG22_13320 [Atopobiaceae bacterium]|nr:hypothetical protein [Atopobiaceae bacterium]